MKKPSEIWDTPEATGFNRVVTKDDEFLNYNQIDHSHCWGQDNPPCGIKGRHRCRLCEKEVPVEGK